MTSGGERAPHGGYANPAAPEVPVTGLSYASQFKVGYATAAYDAATGKQLWLRRYDGPDGENQALSVAVSPGGSKVFVTGCSLGSTTGIDYATLADAAATGAERWVQRYNGFANGDDSAFGLGVSRGGSKVFVVGGSVGAASGSDIVTVAYHA